MDLFVTPEKQRNHPPSVSLGKTPVRRKLIVDDDNEVVSEKKGQSRTSGGGLRQFSVMGQCESLSLKNSLCVCFDLALSHYYCLLWDFISQFVRSWKPRR